MTLESGSDGPHLLIIAGIHGDEFEPMLAVRQLFHVFSDSMKLKKGKLTLVPIVNIPAYKAGSRTAGDGRDLARICPGKVNGSITEQIAFEISNLIRSVDFLIDMHTGGSMSEIFPLIGYMLHNDRSVLDRQRAMARAFGLAVTWGTSPLLEGRTLSVARDAGVPAIYTEYGGGGSCDRDIVKALTEGCIRVMVSLDIISLPETKVSNNRYIVEDFRENSGHLQIMYPSPAEGVLSALKNIGQTVRKNEIIATVYNPVTNEKKEILAAENGMIFRIRKRALVSKNTSIASILPITQPGKIVIQ